MPEDVALLHGRNESVVKMQIGAADGRRRDLDDRVMPVQDPGIRDLRHLDVSLAVPTVGFHYSSPFRFSVKWRCGLSAARTSRSSRTRPGHTSTRCRWSAPPIALRS